MTFTQGAGDRVEAVKLVATDAMLVSSNYLSLSNTHSSRTLPIGMIQTNTLNPLEMLLNTSLRHYNLHGLVHQSFVKSGSYKIILFTMFIEGCHELNFGKIITYNKRTQPVSSSEESAPSSVDDLKVEASTEFVSTFGSNNNLSELKD